jgi:hypothetical protein
MKPFHSWVLRAIVVALLLVSVGANVARADDSRLTISAGGDGGSTQSLPEDPGLEY